MTATTVAERIREAIDASPLTQREIAARSGFSRPNVVSMMKSGEMKVPLDRLPALARTLGIDPAEFLSLALFEYHPDIYEALEMLLNGDEVRLVRMYREANAKGNIRLDGHLLLGLRSLLYLARRAADD